MTEQLQAKTKMQQRKFFQHGTYKKSQQRNQGQLLAMADVNFITNYGKLQNHNVWSTVYKHTLRNTIDIQYVYL